MPAVANGLYKKNRINRSQSCILNLLIKREKTVSAARARYDAATSDLLSAPAALKGIVAGDQERIRSRQSS